MTQGELLLRMNSNELSEWMAFDRLEHIPNSWLQTGILASTIATCGMAKLKKQPTPEDFMPTYKTKQNPVSSLRAMFSAMDAAK